MNTSCLSLKEMAQTYQVKPELNVGRNRPGSQVLQIQRKGAA